MDENIKLRSQRLVNELLNLAKLFKENPPNKKNQ